MPKESLFSAAAYFALMHIGAACYRHLFQITTTLIPFTARTPEVRLMHAYADDSRCKVLLTSDKSFLPRCTIRRQTCLL